MAFTASAISRKGWHEKVTQCEWEGCDVKFSMFTRQKNCYRCGFGYCSNHVKFQRKLNQLGQPDEKGVLAPVCGRCFFDKKIIQTIGYMRDATQKFCEFRVMKDPLEVGFQVGVIDKLVRSAHQPSKHGSGPLALLTSFIPQSDPFMSQISNCSLCKAKFGVLKHRHPCAACSNVVCSNCLRDTGVVIQLLTEAKELLVRGHGEQRTSAGSWPAPATKDETPVIAHCCISCEQRVISLQARAKQDRMAKRTTEHMSYKIFTTIEKCRAVLARTLPEFHVRADAALQALDRAGAAEKERLFDTAAQQVDSISQQLEVLKKLVDTLNKLQLQAPDRSAENRLYSAMYGGLVEWLEERTPEFHRKRKLLFAGELKYVHDAYLKCLLVHRQMNRDTKEFAARFNKQFQDVLSCLKSDYQVVVNATGRDWRKAQDSLQEAVEAHQEPVVQVRSATGKHGYAGAMLHERAFVRQCAVVIRGIYSDLCDHTSENRVLKSKKALGILESEIDKEDEREE